MNCADVSIVGGTSARTFVGPSMVVLNLPGYPTVPEFPNPTDDGGQTYYSNAPTITITAPSVAPTPTTSATSTVPSTSSTVASSTSSSTAPSPTGCVDNDSYCVNTIQFAVCSNNRFLVQSCAPGTQCFVRLGRAICDFPTSPPPPPPPPTTSATSTSSSSAPLPTTTCTTGSSRCASASTRELCSNGIWYQFPCPRGTSCVVRGSIAFCQ
jgi:hypothetical protein